MRTLVGSPEPAPQPVVLQWLNTSSMPDMTVSWSNWCSRCGLANGTHYIGCATLAGRPAPKEEP